MIDRQGRFYAVPGFRSGRRRRGNRLLYSSSHGVVPYQTWAKTLRVITQYYLTGGEYLLIDATHRVIGEDQVGRQSPIVVFQPIRRVFAAWVIQQVHHGFSGEGKSDDVRTRFILLIVNRTDKLQAIKGRWDVGKGVTGVKVQPFPNGQHTLLIRPPAANPEVSHELKLVGGLSRWRVRDIRGCTFTSIGRHGLHRRRQVSL
jgi:hypothetical protein